MSGQPKRLSKVANELGVGIPRLIEVLTEKGFEKLTPNSKIEDDTYAMLESMFHSDKQAKEKSVKLSENRVVRETITLEDKMTKQPQQEDEAYEVDEIFIRNVSEPEIAKPEAKKANDSVTQNEQAVVEPVNQETAAELETKEDPTPVKESPSEPETKGPKILAKINLEDVDPRLRKKKADEEKRQKEAELAAEKAKQQEIKEEEPLEVNIVESAEPAVEAPKEEVKQESQSPQIEHIETKFEKLSGVTVLGKIEIKEEPKKKKPVASSSPEKQPDKKKKRKRIGVAGDQAKKPKDTKDFGKKKKETVELKRELTEEEIQNQVRETLARLSANTKSKASKYRKAKRDTAQQALEEQRIQEAEDQKILKVTEFVTVSELSALMSVNVNQVIGACMSLGLFVSINQRLDGETISIVAEEFGYTIEFTTQEIDESNLLEADIPERLEERPPIVTIMGHVDHGKTSLLDYIRKANVIAGEAGGITQHIGAYSVELKSGRHITFLDTPGHEAFTAMRARGAQVTDVVIIVIAADDKVMPQTKEAINHAQAAGVPMIFALNKIDKDGANPDKIREELSAMNILVEEWGGKYQCQEISAKKGINVEELLEKVLLEAELLELKADPVKKAHGTIIEASLDKGKGYVSTVLVQGGSLKVGDMVLAGSQFGRVKAMFNERNLPIKVATPSTPVSLLGLNGAPNAGDRFLVLEDERQVKEIANKRLQLQREQGVKTQKHLTLDEIGRRIAIGDFKELNVIVKGDVDGSVEALSDSLIRLSTEQIQVRIIHKSVGQVSESDVLLASASSAIIIGFQVRPSGAARKLAEKEEIEIRSYSVIYDAIDDVKSAMEGMLAPKFEEKITCNIEVRETFKITKVGTVAGCYVLDGKVNRNTKIRLIRDGVVVHTGELGSLKRFKDDVKEVSAGYECGLNINNFNDVKVGDIIEGFESVEIKQTLN